MALIVEDGTGVLNANTYLSLVDAQALAVNMGLDLTNVTENDLIQAIGEINKYSMSFLSSRSTTTQNIFIDFPRVGFVDNNGLTILSDEIPQGVKYAQVQAASDILNGYEVYQTSDGKNISNEELSGVFKVGYFNSGTDNDSAGGNKSLATINFLKPYIDIASGLVGFGGNSGEMIVNS